nr:hypothetical protein CFP56_69385 [Quercus suber]
MNLRGCDTWPFAHATGILLFCVSISNNGLSGRADSRTGLSYTFARLGCRNIASITGAMIILEYASRERKSKSWPAMSSSDALPADTATRLNAQWRNPQDIFTILMIIGGDIVKVALAQVCAGPVPYLTPVSFSFGWVGEKPPLPMMKLS